MVSPRKCSGGVQSSISDSVQSTSTNTNYIFMQVQPYHMRLMCNISALYFSHHLKFYIIIITIITMIAYRCCCRCCSHCGFPTVILECWLPIGGFKLSNIGFGNAIEFGHFWIQSTGWLSIETGIYAPQRSAIRSICWKYGKCTLQMHT